MTGWQTRYGHPTPVRVQIDPAFVRALQQLTKERGGGYIPLSEVEARAARCQAVIPPLPALVVIPPLPLAVVIPELPR